MHIRLENLSVNRLGPIASIKWQFKDVNLIYGKNEQGKTFLVEYLLSSLFKNHSKTRPLTDSGQINISGLAENVMRFDPKSRKKIEDYLYPDDKPVDLSRLLVVKAGVTKFSSDSEKGVTKTVLKDYLSDQRVLDLILNQIPSNIQKSSWENGQLIPGQQSGDCRTYNNYIIELQKIDELLAEVDEKYTMGEIMIEKHQLEEVDGLLQVQEQARRYSAYQKNSRIKALSEELKQLPQTELDAIKKINNDVQRLKKQIQKDKDQINALELKCIHYHWLETAIAECEKRPEALSLKSDLFFTILGVVLIVTTVGLAFLQLPWGALAAGLLALLFFILISRRYRLMVQQRDDIAEINRIFAGYQKRFGQKAQAITDLKSTHAELQPDYYALEQIKSQSIVNQRELDHLEQELEARLSVYCAHTPDHDDPDERINALQKKRDQLEEAHKNENIALAALGVEPEDYFSGPVDIQYDRELFNKLNHQKNELVSSINKKETSLLALKQRICDFTSSDINSEWDKIINDLRVHRDKTSQLKKEIMAKIGSGAVITKVIQEIQDREDEGIAKALAADTICEPIKALTQTYQGIEMDGDDIIVFSENERFPVHHLSTGAQEQILLALRIGIAAHYLQDKKMFLILDDAFQHSDWQRREWMVDQMAYLASIGWQIIYFAMDDHIKGLFEERIKPRFMDRYVMFELAK